MVIGKRRHRIDIAKSFVVWRSATTRKTSNIFKGLVRKGVAITKQKTNASIVSKHEVFSTRRVE